MKKRVIALALAFVFCISFSISACAMPDESETTPPITDAIIQNAVMQEPISEYQMALEKAAAMEAEAQVHGTPVKFVENPLEAYKRDFEVRAAMDPEILRNVGYSDEDISVLQDYRFGLCTFEEAAARVAAELTPTIWCSLFTPEKYTISYSWEWNKLPASVGVDGFALAGYGINSQNQTFETRISLTSSSVQYYKMSGEYYKSEYPSRDVGGARTSASFELFKLDDLGHENVWAKKGSINMTIVPVITGGAAFASVRAAGAYGHSSSTFSGSMTISASVNPLEGDISFSFSPSSSFVSVQPYGKKQVLFYVNGDYDEEM